MSDLNDRLQQARDRIAQSLLPKVADASKAASESRLDTAPKGSNLREHIANGGIVTNNLVNYFNDDAVAKTIKAREELAAQQNDYVGISTANLRSSNPFVSAAANTANLVGGAVGTLAQWANTAAGDEFTAQAIALEAGTPPQMIEAYNTFNKIRSQKQTLAEEHGILLDMLRNKQGDPVAVKKKLAEVEATYKGIVVDPNVEAALSTQIGDETYLDRLDRSQELRHKGVRVQAGSGEGILPAMNVSDFSNPYFKKPLEEAATSSQFVKDTNKEADAAFDRGDYLEGIGKKALSFGAVVGNVLKEAPSNPMGVLQYTAESAPYFALPGVGTAAIVNQTAVEGRNKFEQRTGNALPTTGENLAMLGTDVLYGALNYLGDKGINNAARGITAGVGRTNTQILRDAVTGTGQSTISAVGKEAAAEGAQTYLEDSGQNLSTYFNPETVGLGTAIGGLSAGIVSGPGAVVSGAKQASLDRFMNTEEGKAIADQMELAKVPTEELSDITSPKYNPHEVIRRTTNSVKGEDSVATIKETNLAELDKIGAIVDSLDGAIADAESAQAEYVKTSAMLDQLEANDVDGSKAGMIAAVRSTLDESNAQNLSVGYEENIKQLQAKKAKADELYLSVREEIIKSNAYLDSLDFVDGVAVNGKPKAASEDTVTNDYISEASGREAARLAQEPDNDYTEEEVSRLRTFSDAVAAANRRKNLNVVGDDIAQGSGKGASKRFKGLGSYLVDAANLVKSGNDRAKKALLNTLTKFSENHESKVAAVKQAFADAQGTDVTIVGKDATTGKWNILDTVSAEDYKANYEKTLAKTGSLGIHSGSNANGFISGMEQESKDIQAVLASVEDTLTTGKLPVHVIAAQGKPKTTESSKGTTKSSTTSKEEKRNPQMEAAYKDVFDKPIGEWDESDFSTIGAQAYDTGSTISTPEEAVKANSFSQKMTKKIIADGIAKNRSTADIMSDVVNVAYSSDFNMKTQGINALYAYINMRKGLVTEAENKLKGKSTPATKPTAKAPVESKPVLPVIPQEAVENEEVDAAVATARQSVVPPEQAAQATKAPAGKPKETKPTASTPEPVLKTGESSTRVTPKGYTEVITQLDVYTQEVNVTAKDGMVTTHVTRTTYPDIVSTKVDVGGKKVTVKKSVLIERNLKKGGEVSKVFVFSEDGVIPKKQVLNDLETDADIVNNLAKQDGGKQLYTPAYSDERANTGKGTKATTPKTHFIDYSGDTTTNTEVDVNALLDEANAASFEEEYDNQAEIIEGELRGEPTPTEAEPSTPEPTVEDTLTAKLEKAKEDALNELEDLFKEAGKGLKQNADPVLITKIMAATVKLTGIYFALGTIKFADWAKAILTDLKKRGVDPEDVKPLLKQAYLATAASSEVKDEILDQMDDAKTVRAFDIDSLLLGSKDTKEVPKGNGEIKLNEGQEKAFSEIMTFLENTDPSVNTHTLIGAAGTGKTTIVNSILKALREAGSVYGTVVLTSPTHRANTVTMSKNKSEKVQTLHKLLNLLPWIDLDKFSDYDSSKVTFKRGDSEDDTGFPSSGLVIVDESSMIGDDLYDFLIKSLDANPGVKILFLGDAAQLRPVSKKNKNGERVGIKDDAKDSKALTESNSVSILTKVERAENSALLGESVYLRNGKGNFSATNNMTDSNGVVFLNEKKTFIDKVVDMFKSKEFLKDPLLVRVVAFRNEVIKDLNNRIREGIYGKNPPDYVVGELLLGYNAYGKANPGGILPIANGVDYIIDKIGPTESKEILGVSVLTAEITFHDVFGLAKSKKLRFILPSNTEATWTALGLVGDKFLTHDANGKFIPERDTRARYKRKKPFEEVLGEYVFPRDIGVMEKKKGDTKEKLRPIHNQTINYGYAHTIHKSQGGTYSYVFVEGRDIDSPDADLNKRLRYVGTTRAKKGAFIYVGPGVAIDTSKPVTYLSFTPADAKDKSKVETPIIEETPKTVDPILDALNESESKTTGTSIDASNIYDRLNPSKTVTENVALESWSNLKDATEAITDKAVISTRIKGSNEHFGNPFSSTVAGLIKTKSTEESVVRYLDWILSETTDINPEQHAWIREQLKSQALVGKPILYYKELGEPSHANALDYLINTEFKVDPEVATETQTINPEYRGKVILAHAGTGKSFATKSNPDIVDGDVLYYQATNTIIDKYNKANGENVPKIKDVTGTRGVFDAWGEYGDKAAIQALEVLKVNNKNVVGELSKVTPADVAKWKKSLLGGDSDTKAIATLEKYLANKTEIDRRKAEAIRRRNEIYQEYANQARALADSGKTVLSSSIRPELVAVADIVIAQNDVNFIAKNLTSSERVNQNSEVDLGKIQKKIDKAIRVEGELGNKGKRITLKNLGDKQFISDLLFGSDEVIAESVIDEGVSVHGKPKLMSKPIREIDNELPVGGMSVFTGAANVTPRERQAAQAKIINSPNTTETKVVAPIKRKDGSTTPGRTTKIEVSGLQKANLVVASFYQKAKSNSVVVAIKDFFTTHFSNDTSANEFLDKFLGRPTTPEELNLIRVFRDFHTKRIQPNVRSLLTGYAQLGDFKLTDYLTYLFPDEANPSLDENIVTAISAAAFSFLLEKSGKFTHAEEDVAELLGLDEKTPIPHVVMRRYQNVGSSRAAIVSYLGRSIFESLSLRVQQDATEERKQRMINAFGSLAYNIMAKEGLLQVTEVLNSVVAGDIARVTGQTTDHTVKNDETLKGDHVRGFTTYARVAYDTKTKKSKRGDWLYENNAKLRPDIQEYKDAARGVSSVLNNLFGITNVDTAPLFKEPKGLNQASTDQLGTQVPSALKDNTEQMMKKKYVPNGDTYKAMLHLRDNNIEALEAMIGVVSDEDIAKMHVTQRSSVISTNEGLRRSLENGLAFVSSVPTTEGQYAPIYLPMKVWVLNRVGVTSNLFNEQGDKVHRALTVMSQHVQTIAATQPLVNGEISLVGRALLGAAAYMEEITLSIGKVAVDKTAASVYLPALMEYLSLDRVSSAIASYGKLQDGTATMEDITAVRDLVIEFGGGAMSLASVNVLYQLSTIKDGKATLKTEGEVTTNVAIGSDGVTNGMALSMLVYGIGRPRNKQGATVNSLHNAAGYFYVGDKQETLMAYRSSGADDLYQQLARIQKDLWNTLVTNNRNPVEQAKHAALAFFDPKFGERAGAKVGLVPFVYGSGFTSIKAAQSRAFISSIYATMAKLASSNGGNPTTASIVEFDTHLSALLGKPETFLMNAVLAAREGLTVKEELIKAKVDAILETELTRNMIDKITEVESGIRGTITQNAMKVMSGDLIAARGRVNNLASLGFDIFKGLFDFTRDETLKNLESQGLTKYRVAQNGDRITLEGLTVKQMDRLMADLNKYGPVVVSVAGTYSTNPVESAHAMYIVTKVPQTAELPVSKLHIKTQFDIKHTPNSATVPTFSNFESPLYTITIEYRGPANNASIVQAMDAWVTTQVSSKFDALNHHDENASGVTEAVAMAQFQNKVLFDAALQYGVYKEVLRGSLFRPLRGIIKYGESSTGKETDASSELARRNFAVELSKGTFSSLKQYADENFNIKNKTSYSDLLKAIVTAMYDVEVNKVSALKGLSAISQYSLEGGEYKITPRDKQAIEDKIAALKEELALDLEVATKLGKDLDKLYFSTITTPKAQAKPEVVRTIGSNGRVTQRSTKKIKFRRAGDQSNILNPVYLGNDFLVVNDGIVDVAASIANIDFSGTYMDSALGKAMLKLILSSLPKGLTVQYLTPDNVTPDMAKALVNPNAKDSAVDKLSRGDSWYYNNNIVIAVDGRGHAVSLIHELVHAVTSATVGIGGDPNTIDAFTRLSDRLKEYAADNAASISPHTLKKIEYATGKLSEFITVMLTEQDVFELARKIPTSLKTRTRSANTKGMATLLKDFLTVIADYFRSKVNAAKDSLNDMESLLESTLVIAMDAIQLNKTYFDSGTSEDFEGELDNDLDNKKADAVRLVTEFRAQEVFEALPSSGDLEADQRLSALMLSIIDSTYTPISNSRANTTYTPNEVWGKAISEGRTPYGTGAIAAGFELSQRELFAIEALEVTVKGVIDSGIVSPAYKELLKVFDTAKTVLSAKDFHKGDWSKATEHQKEVAEAKHRYLFNIAQSANGRSDFMSKFVAMALGSHEVHALLTFSEKKAKAKDSTLLSKIEAMYEHALRWVSGYLTNTSTYQQAKNKLPILVRNLVDIDHKKRDQAVGNVFDKLNVGVGKLDKFLKERGNKLDASLTKLVDGTKYPRIAGVTKTAGIIAGGRAMDLLDLAQQYRDLANPGKPLGWKAEILNEMATPSKAKQAVLRLLRRYTLIQTGRKNHSSTTVEALLESFADGGMKLSKSDKEALTYGVLRTDMQVLFSQYGRIGLRRLLSSPQFLDQRIQELEVDIIDPLHRVRVKDLAFYMTTGETNDMLAENALSIARNVGMQAVMKESEVDPDYLSKLDELISLRALEYMDTHHKDSLIKIMDIENARTEGSANGVETLMRYHKRIQEDAKDALYEGNTTAFVKGYIPDITDPHREIKVVTTEAERKQMKDMGYTFVRAYRSHPSEPGGGTRYVYVTEASSKTRYVSGAVSMTGKVKNGTSIFANSDLSYVGEHNVIRRETDLARERILNINPSSYDPRVDGTRGVAPTYSNGGTIIDFRYVHSHATKDSLLSRNNNFAKVLGAFAGSNFDKVSTSDHNKAVIDVITADYQENYTRYPRSFVEVGPDSPDPRVRAMYFMLPEDTRNYVQSIWGKGTPMYIRNTLLLPLFGTSKYTIGLAFDKNPELRNLPERIITGVFSAVFKDTAKLRALQAETLNQSLVSWYKSTVVIRNLTTLMGNQASNTGILLAMNVPATDIYRNSVLAYRAGMDYMSDTRELIRAQNAMNTGIGNAAVHLQTIRKHSDSLARNPLKEFLDAGMLTTIVEDVSLEINDYEYKSRLEQKIDDQLDKLNPTIRKIGATLLVAPSTELYQKLATLTQLSDFTAKYVLYSHMRNKSEEKLSHEDALALADTVFINYDVPTSMELQYGNDMGFLMFTKYTLRVQRAMAYLIKNHKGGLFAQHLLANTLGMPAATIPLFINQLGNPLQPGGLGAVGALNQPLPIKMLLGGIN